MGCPCLALQLSVRLQGELVAAASFLDLGLRSCSSIYGIFEPEESGRRLGILTMLLEMDYARQGGVRILLPGLRLRGDSPYDYKKEVRPAWVWNWREWEAFKRDDYSKQALPLPEGILARKREPNC